MHQNLTPTITFRPATSSDEERILQWLKRPDVAIWWQDDGRTLRDLRLFVKGKTSEFQHWLGFIGETPYAYLMTSEVTAEDELCWRHREPEGRALTLDYLIGDESFLGKGLGAQTLKAFAESQAQNVTTFMLDPNPENERAVHVYEKVGFRKVEEFTPDSGPFSGKPHILMKWVFR